MIRRASLLFTFLFLFPVQLFAQHTVGRLAVGAHLGGNAWFTDFNQHLIGLGGSIDLRYGVSRAFSVGLEFGYERLKSEQDPLRADIPYDFMRVDATPLSLVGNYHFTPGKEAAPYAFVGIGFMRYTRSVPTGRIPNDRTRTSVRVPVGVGIETFSTKNFSFDFHLEYALFNNKTDAVLKGFPDGALYAKFGIRVHFGSSDDDDDDVDGLTNGEERRLGTNPTNPDTDEDGLTDATEVRRFRTDPLNPDTDGDKLKDGEEILRTFTSPFEADTDGDGVNDFDEVARGTDPLDPKSKKQK